MDNFTSLVRAFLDGTGYRSINWKHNLGQSTDPKLFQSIEPALDALAPHFSFSETWAKSRRWPAHPYTSSVTLCLLSHLFPSHTHTHMLSDTCMAVWINWDERSNIKKLMAQQAMYMYFPQKKAMYMYSFKENQCSTCIWEFLKKKHAYGSIP